MKKSMYSTMAALLAVGASIWAIPLIWYFKQKEKNKQ